MIDVDARGRYEAELLRAEAARIADTETALQSVLDGDVLVSLVTNREGPPLSAVTRDRISARRRVPVLVAGFAAAAAAIVAIALVVVRDVNDSGPADRPSTTLTVPAVPPRALFDTRYEPSAPGTYFVDEVAGSATPRISVTLGEGWSNFENLGIEKDGTGTVMFSRPRRVYKDACHWRDGFVAGPATTLDGLVAAFSEQGGWVDVTTPSDASVDGYTGKSFQHTVQAKLTDCDLWGDFGALFRSWTDDVGRWYDYQAGDIETLRIIDVNGTIIVVSTRLDPAHQDATAVAELAAIVDSIRIVPT